MPLASRTPERPLTSAIMRNVYTDPAREMLQRGISQPAWIGDVAGRIEITDLEIKTAMTDERTFVALLNARFRMVLDDMISCFGAAPTLPVHDQPAPERLRMVWREEARAR